VLYKEGLSPRDVLPEAKKCNLKIVNKTTSKVSVLMFQFVGGMYLYFLSHCQFRST
jgi:hypothetical protein